ncbi:MAG: YraN family protein [Deltaproteobacteria bacterium]|nr:YraN family protein [Deltaproteobacteria bacterium]
MMKTDNKTLKGQKAEEVALNFLKKRGHQLLEKNWRSRWGEIDLITFHQNRLYFVEVKYRENLSFGSGYEAIHPKKQEKLMKTALLYLQKNQKASLEIKWAACVISKGENQVGQIDFLEFPLDLKSHYY